MYYFILTVFLTLVVFFGRLPATIRRIKAQREALRPVPPVARVDHLPCIVNTIGAALTEFFVLGLLALGVFLGSSAVLGTLDQAPDLTTGVRHISVGALLVMMALGVITGFLVIGGKVARNALTILFGLAMLAALVASNVGDQWPAIAIVALFAGGVPALLILVIRLFR